MHKRFPTLNKHARKKKTDVQFWRGASSINGHGDVSPFAWFGEEKSSLLQPEMAVHQNPHHYRGEHNI